MIKGTTILLQTEGKAKLTGLLDKTNLKWKESYEDPPEHPYYNYHLYIISDCKINSGDWVMWKKKQVVLVKKVDNKFTLSNEAEIWSENPSQNVKKIIMSSCKELGLQDIPNEYLERYCTRDTVYLVTEKNNDWVTIPITNQ